MTEPTRISTDQTPAGRCRLPSQLSQPKGAAYFTSPFSL